MSRVLTTALLLLLIAAVPAVAQIPQPFPSSGPAAPGFLPRFDFAISLEHLVDDDSRFVWDAHIAGELDFVDYGVGRVTFGAAYETVLGNEFQPFDPEQGHYTLEGAASGRAGPVEIAGVLHHVSRHLGDRAKDRPVDWNMLGGRVRAGGRRGRSAFDARVDLRRTIQKSFVDYTWELNGAARVQSDVTPHVAVIAGGGGRILATDGSRGRGTQHGLRGEGGVRLSGQSAALELIVAVERRVDPYQLEFASVTWVAAGFRLTSR